MTTQSSIFFQDDISIADFRILIYQWNRETGTSDFLVDISSLATTAIHIEKERNMPDILTVTIEYTQFKEKLKYEGSEPQNILMPFLTEVKIQRNFKTVFAGTLFHLNLQLGEVGKELVQLKCCSWGEHFEKRYVSGAFHGSYPDIARQLVRAGQHEMNWFDNFSFEYSDEYFQGWSWSYTKDLKEAWDAAEAAEATAYANYKASRTDANREIWEDAQKASDDAQKLYDDNQHCPRASELHWDGGISFLKNQYITTYSMTPNNTMAEGTAKFTLPQMYFGFWYKAYNTSGTPTLRLQMAGDNENEFGTVRLTFNAALTATSDWTYYEGTIPSTNIVENVHWLRLTAINSDIDLEGLQLYTKPTAGDAYDLTINENGSEENQHYWDTEHYDLLPHIYDNQRVRHYHRQNIKTALYNLAKLTNSLGVNRETGEPEPDTFEYEFDEDKNFNMWFRQGTHLADPAFSATYPGIIKSLTIERGLEDISNLNYAEASEEKTVKDSDGNSTTITRKWTSAYSSGGSMNRFGAMADFKTFESVHSYDDLDVVGGSELNIYDEVVDIPEIAVDSNIYNMGNVFLGDTIFVKVLSDPLFTFINGTYRVFKFSVDISIDSVEEMKLTLVPPDMSCLQLVSFPKDYKFMKNDLKRLSTGANT